MDGYKHGTGMKRVGLIGLDGDSKGWSGRDESIL